MCVDDFEVERKLGEGAYSCVYKVRRASDKMDYAMKSIKMGALSAKERDNAVNEIRFLASLNCPEIIGYKEAFYDEKTNVLNIIMEYMPGGDLLNKIKSLKKKNQFLDEKVVWLYILQMTRGLKKLHDMNILHRDFKCANVMLSRDHKNLKLGDLNVSKVAKKGLLYTQTGTPYYASPEVWRDKPYNSKSDVWSLGCVVYELITLNPPFKAQDMEGLFKKILKGQYDALPAWYSQDLADFLSLCLQVNPKTRLTTAELLENPLVQKRLNIAQELNVKEYVQSELDSQRQELLKTLKIGKNLKALNSILPEPQYENQVVLQQEAIQDQVNQNTIQNNNNNNKVNASRNSQHESNNSNSSIIQQQQQQQSNTPLNEILSNRKQQQSPLIPLQQQQQQRPLVLERKLSQPSSHRYNNNNNGSNNNNNSKISPSPYLIQPRKMSQPYIHLPSSASRINSMNNIQSDISLEINEKNNNNNNNSSSNSSNIINNKKNIHSKIVSYAKPTRSRSIENVIKSSIQSSILSANNINSIVNASSQVKRVPVRQESVPTLPPINQQQPNGQQQQLSGSREQLDNNNNNNNNNYNNNNLFSNYGAAAALKKRNYHKNYEISQNQPLSKLVNSSLNDSPPPSKSRSIVSSGSGTTNSSSLVPSQQLRSRASDLMVYAGKKAI